VSAYVEARTQLRDALSEWDFTGIFPSGWPKLPDGTDARGPLIVPAHPYDIIDNMLEESKKGLTGPTMTQPIISIVLGHSTDTFRSLGDVHATAVNPPATGKWRRSTRMGLVFLVSCWADERLGGYETVELLGGEIQSCVFFNRSRLAAFRHLRCHNQEPAYIDRSEIWTMDLYVEGDALVSYDETLPNLPYGPFA
jgi:hypothetical protein